MSFVSLHGGRQILASYFIPDQFNAPDELWLALTLVVPAPGATGADLVEPGDPAYQRIVSGRGSEWWGLSGESDVINAVEYVWPVPSVDWGTVAGWALCEEFTDGQIIAGGDLVTPYQVIAAADTQVAVAAGTLRVRWVR